MSSEEESIVNRSLENLIVIEKFQNKTTESNYLEIWWVKFFTFSLWRNNARFETYRLGKNGLEKCHQLEKIKLIENNLWINLIESKWCLRQLLDSGEIKMLYDLKWYNIVELTEPHPWDLIIKIEKKRSWWFLRNKVWFLSYTNWGIYLLDKPPAERRYIYDRTVNNGS